MKNSRKDYYQSNSNFKPHDYEQESSGSDKVLVFLDWLRTFLLVTLIGLFVTLFVLQRNTISGPSMEPTLSDNDQIFVEKISKHFNIDRGDIITIDETNEDLPDNLLIKRVIALPGERFEIKEGIVYINGQALSENYLPVDSLTNADPETEYSDIVLAEDEYFVLGDNRSVSKDSRRIGPINKDQIIGKLLFRFYPFDSFGRPE